MGRTWTARQYAGHRRVKGSFGWCRRANLHSLIFIIHPKHGLHVPRLLLQQGTGRALPKFGGELCWIQRRSWAPDSIPTQAAPTCHRRQNGFPLTFVDSPWTIGARLLLFGQCAEYVELRDNVKFDPSIAVGVRNLRVLDSAAILSTPHPEAFTPAQRVQVTRRSTTTGMPDGVFRTTRRKQK